jgi:hypothetical protein
LFADFLYLSFISPKGNYIESEKSQKAGKPRNSKGKKKRQNLPDFGELPQKGEAPHVPGEHRREVEEGELVLCQQGQVNPALLQHEGL